MPRGDEPLWDVRRDCLIGLGVADQVKFEGNGVDRAVSPFTRRLSK